MEELLLVLLTLLKLDLLLTFVHDQRFRVFLLIVERWRAPSIYLLSKELKSIYSGFLHLIPQFLLVFLILHQLRQYA